MLESLCFVEFLPGLGKRQERCSRWIRIYLGKTMNINYLAILTPVG